VPAAQTLYVTYCDVGVKNLASLFEQAQTAFWGELTLVSYCTLKMQENQSSPAYNTLLSHISQAKIKYFTTHIFKYL